MSCQHRLDFGRACAALEAVDDLLALDQHERRNVRDPELLRKVGLVLDLDAHHPHTRALFAREVREQALHATSRTRTLGREEHEQGLVIQRASSWGCEPRGSGDVDIPG